jgi:phenylpropionate dioxygenase-like ring-hydroxylating dioxygenase large terminal subunit
LEDFSLKPVRVEQWNGFIFVSLDEAVPPLTEFLDPMPHDLQGYRTPTSTRLLRQQYVVKCNWKNFHDNTLCDYHVAIAHRTTLSPLQGPVRLYEHHFGKYVNLLYTPTPMDWRSRHRTLEHLGDRVRYGFFTYGIFPNLHSFALPNGICGWIRIDPITVETCQLTVDVYGVPGVSPDSDTLERDFGETTQEDIVLTEGVQRGYASGVYTAGVANGLEARILHQQRLIREWLQRG